MNEPLETRTDAALRGLETRAWRLIEIFIPDRRRSSRGDTGRKPRRGVSGRVPSRVIADESAALYEALQGRESEVEEALRAQLSESLVAVGERTAKEARSPGLRRDSPRMVARTPVGPPIPGRPRRRGVVPGASELRERASAGRGIAERALSLVLTVAARHLARGAGSLLALRPERPEARQLPDPTVDFSQVGTGHDSAEAVAGMSPESGSGDRGEPLLGRCPENTTVFGGKFMRCERPLFHPGHCESTDAAGSYEWLAR